MAYPAHAQGNIQPCQLDGWAADRDPAGLNVRAAASAQAPVLGVLPAYVFNEDGRGFGIPVNITAAQDGWFRINSGWDDPERSSLPLRPTYAGVGWVAANMVRFRLQTGRAHAAPDAASAVIVDIGFDDLTDMAEITRVHACSGKWVQVDLRFTQRRNPQTGVLLPVPAEPEAIVRQVWALGVCGNQETMCDQTRP